MCRAENLLCTWTGEEFRSRGVTLSGGTGSVGSASSVTGVDTGRKYDVIRLVEVWECRRGRVAKSVGVEVPGCVGVKTGVSGEATFRLGGWVDP